MLKVSQGSQKTMIGRIRGFAMQIMSLQTRMLKRSVALIIGLTLRWLAEAGANHDWSCHCWKASNSQTEWQTDHSDSCAGRLRCWCEMRLHFACRHRVGPEKACLIAGFEVRLEPTARQVSWRWPRGSILLIEVNGLTAVADEFLAQSCLRSISMGCRSA